MFNKVLFQIKMYVIFEQSLKFDNIAKQRMRFFRFNQFPRIFPSILYYIRDLLSIF